MADTSHKYKMLQQLCESLYLDLRLPPNKNITKSAADTKRNKCKRDHDDIFTEQSTKKKKKSQRIKNYTHSPMGFNWNNNSCAYNAVLTILGHTIASYSIQWQSGVSNQSSLLNMFYELYNRVLQKEYTLVCRTH